MSISIFEKIKIYKKERYIMGTKNKWNAKTIVALLCFLFTLFCFIALVVGTLPLYF